jgi:hypothetical protein
VVAWLDRACERPPAGRYAPRLSPFVRGTVQKQNRRRRFCWFSVPLTKGDSRGAKRPAGGRSHTIVYLTGFGGRISVTTGSSIPFD